MSTQVIAAPSAAHTTISVAVTPGQTIQFAMELGKAVFERPELDEGAKSPDLVITLEDGSVIELKGFFVTGEDDVQLPLLQLADGTQVEGGDFLASIDPSFDISTAAGPSTAVPMSGGLGEMAESVSLGIDGVERLGSLGSEGYTSSFVASNSAEIYSVAQVNALGNDSPGTSGPGAPNGGGSDGGTSPPPPDNNNGIGGGDGGGNEPGSPTPPHNYTRVALLGVDGTKDPIASVNLLTAFGISNPHDISCSESSNYNVSISADGVVSFSLKDTSGPAPLENLTITVDGKSYVVQVASTSGELKDLQDTWQSVTWTDGTEGAGTTTLDFVDKVWAGVTKEQLLGAQGVSGSAVVAPHVEGAADGVNITPTTEIHLQMTDSSLAASTDTPGAETSTVVLTNLNGGSFTISNEHTSLFSVQHAEPSRSVQENYDYYQEQSLPFPDDLYNPSKLASSATVVTAMGAQGPGSISHMRDEEVPSYDNAVNSITVTDGDVIIKAGSGAPVIEAGDQVGFVSGTYAVDGGKNEVTADNITISASADGFAQGSPAGQAASVTGVRSDGALITTETFKYTGWNGEIYTQKTPTIRENSTTNLTAKEDMTVGVTVTGDTASQDHSHTTYAAVAATEHGHVNINAGGNVLIEANNATTGELNTTGVYGIFSGYGLGEKDLPKLEDFPNPYYLGEGFPGIEGQKYSQTAYQEYLMTLQYQLMEEKLDWNNPDPVTGTPGKTHAQSEVNITTGGDVDVNVNMGSGTYTGSAAAIKASFGDVNIESGADISVHTQSQGMHTGSEAHKLSAVELSNGTLSMKAEGDINISLDANGNNLAVINYQPYAQNYNPYGFTASSVTAKGAVAFTGEAGKNGDVADNQITGINAGNLGFKKETFTVSAKEFAIDVTAYDNGGDTSSTGIQVGGATAVGPYMASMHHFTLAVDAPEMEIAARVVDNAAKPSQGDSKATAISVNQGTLGIIANDPDSLQAMRMYNGRITPGLVVTSLASLNLTAEGANYNVGIEATPTKSKDAEEWDTALATVDIRAKELNINATNGAQPGHSASYGILSVNPEQHVEGYMPNQSSIRLETSKLTINTQGSEKSVGIHASGYSETYNMFGYNPGVEITSTRTNTTYNKGTGEEYSKITTEPLTVIITCTITNGNEQLRGIALEAINGGHIAIKSSDGTYDPYTGQWVTLGKHNDTVILNGDVHVGDLNYIYDPNGQQTYNQSSVLIDTGWGNDRIEINGDVKMGKGGLFTINAGEGDDMIAINGTLGIGTGAHLDINAGDGNNTIAMSGPLQFDQFGYASVTSGSGKDNISLSGGINLGQHGTMLIDAGDGNDIVSLNGGISGENLTYTNENGETHSTGSLQVMGGAGYDLLILKAPDAETFAKWYGDWFTTLSEKDLYDMSFEGIIVQGVSDPSELSWLTNAIEHFNQQSDFQINLQFFGSDAHGHAVNLTMVNDASAMSDSFALDGSGYDNDLLYVRFDGDNLDSLGNLAKAMDNGHIKGVENLLLDMADGQNQELDLSVLKGLFDSKEESTNIILRADNTDTLNLQEAGWHTDGSSHTFEGMNTAYTVYTNADEQQLYVQMVTTVHG